MSAEKTIAERLDDLISEYKVTYSTQYVGERTRDGWKCDAWLCAFSPDSGNAVETFEYFTGLGHRTPDDSVAAKSSRFRLAKVSRNSIAWETHRKTFPDKITAPGPAGVLQSLILDGSACEQPFAHWCDDYGFDPDSIKALRIYHECQENANKLRRVFSRAQISALSDVLQDY